MNLFKWGEKKIQSFRIWGISIMKLYLFLVGSVFGAYFSEFFIKYIWVIAAGIVLTGAWLIFKMFKK